VELLTDGTEKSPILAFCQSIIFRHGETWPPKEQVLAQEFVGWLGANSLQSRDALIELCQSKGVNLSFADLPKELRGWNGSFAGRKQIVIAERELAPVADLHTLFHEFREIIEHEFAGLGYPTLQADDSREVRAEIFAVACRMKCVEREFPALFEMFSNIEKKWVRNLSFAFVFLLTVSHFLSCIYMHQMEEIGYEAERLRR
jgi:hypothetical protein